MTELTRLSPAIVQSSRQGTNAVAERSVPLSTLHSRLIPKRFRVPAMVSFDAFRASTPSQLQALRAVKLWLANLPGGPMLALVGKQGTGKSHLLYAAVRQLLDSFEAADPKDRVGKSAPFVKSWYSFSDELRYGNVAETQAGSRTRDAAEVRSEWWSRDVVMLDEVRPTSGTNFDDTELAKFACHAYDNRIAVLLTTNVHPLAGVMGDAAASRFAQIVIDGPDARQAA